MKYQNQLSFRRDGFGSRETQINAVMPTRPTRLSVYIGSDTEAEKRMTREGSQQLLESRLPPAYR